MCEEGSTSATPEIGRCPLGYYCEDKISRVPCPAGKYGIKEGATSESEGCSECVAGYYCGLGTGELTESIKCPAGHYCLLGTKTAFQYPCEDGFFNNEVGRVRKEQCRPCPPGRYCAGGDPTGDTLCPKGHYCVGRIGSPSKCRQGFYLAEEGATCEYNSFNITYF